MTLQPCEGLTTTGLPPRAASNAGAGVRTSLPPALGPHQRLQRVIEVVRLPFGVAPIAPAPLHPSSVVADGLVRIAPALAGRPMSAKAQSLMQIRHQLTAQLTQVCVFNTFHFFNF